MTNYFKLIPALWRTKGLIQNDIKEDKMSIKDGWKTSEFWGKVALQAGALWAAVGGFVPPKYAVIVVAVAEGIYAAIRGAIKITQLVQAAKQDSTTVTTTAPVTTVTTPS